MTSWRKTAFLFALASLVETLAFGHLGAFTPLYLRELGVPSDLVPTWTGVMSGSSFILGLPLAPLWGVWADRYSRKLIILRSTLGEGVILLLFSVAGEPWHLLVARMLVGFILGNTGVMFAMLADVTPRNQLPFAIGWMTAGGTLGMSVGPFFGGWALGRLTMSQLFLVDAIACWIVVVLLWVLLRESRSRARPEASSMDLLRALPRTVLGTSGVPPLFALYFVVFLGANLQMPFAPLLVEDVYEGPDLPLAIGGAMLATGALSALSAPLLGRLAGRLGPRPVLTGALCAGAAAGVAQAVVPDYGWLLVARAAFGLAQGGSGSLVVSMIAAVAPEDRRSSILNVVLFPGYFAWVLGPLLGSALAAIGIRFAFLGGGVITGIAAGSTLILARRQVAEPERLRE